MNDWQTINDRLEKTFTFGSFAEALAFVNKVGELCEKHNHHPDICLQNYKEVFISTTTHDAGNVVTQGDRKLVEEVDGVVGE